jgi:hypothetical protein
MRFGPRRAVVTLALAFSLAVGQASSAPPVGASPTPTIDRSRLLADTAALADPSFEGRLASSAGGRKAREWIASEFKTIGLRPAGQDGFEQPFSFTVRRLGGILRTGPFRRTFRDAANVLGRLDGTEPTRPAIVISAHYDHLGVRDGVVYPGADDNASGVAALLAVARAMKARGTRHSLVFAAFDAEEQELRGAKAFVGSKQRGAVALNVNLDMLSRSTRREIYVAGTFHTPRLRPAIERLQATTPATIRFGHDRPDLGPDDWTQLSDHGAFHDARIPFLYFGVEDHEDYHQPTDTFDRIDRQFFGDVTALVIDAIIALDRSLP